MEQKPQQKKPRHDPSCPCMKCRPFRQEYKQAAKVKKN